MVALVPASKPARAALAISTFFLFVISFSLAPIQDFEIGHVFPPLESPTRVTRCKKRIRPIQRFNDSRRISSPRDTQKADGIMSRRSTVDSVIPLLVKGFTIHSQTLYLNMVARKGRSTLRVEEAHQAGKVVHPGAFLASAG